MGLLHFDDEDIEIGYVSVTGPTYWDYILQLPYKKEGRNEDEIDFKEFFKQLRKLDSKFLTTFLNSKIRTRHPEYKWKEKQIELPDISLPNFTNNLPKYINNLIVFMPFIGLSNDDKSIISGLWGNFEGSSLFVFPTRQSIAKYYQYVTDEDVILLEDLMDALYSLAKEKLSKETEIYNLIEVFYYKVKYAIALSQLIEQY